MFHTNNSYVNTSTEKAGDEHAIIKQESFRSQDNSIEIRYSIKFCCVSFVCDNQVVLAEGSHQSTTLVDHVRFVTKHD